MAAQAVVTPIPPTASPEGGEDLFFIAMPGVTYRAISDSAMKRGLTFAQALQQALNQWLVEVPPTTLGPQLPVERSKK